jgi:hypothetical protein
VRNKEKKNQKGAKDLDVYVLAFSELRKGLGTSVEILI